MAELAPLSRAAKGATKALIAAAIVDAVAVLGDLAELALSGGADLVQGLIGLAQVLVFIYTGILFLTWWYRAFVNAHAIDPEPFGKLTPRSAVLAWFVPLLNVVYPYYIARKIWWAISEQKSPRPAVPPSLGAWWGCLFAASAAGRASARVDGPELQSLFALASDILGVIAAVQAIKVIAALTPPASGVVIPSDAAVYPQSGMAVDKASRGSST